MTILLLGLMLFIGAHLMPTFVGVRASLGAQLGENGYKGLHTVSSFVGLGLIIYGYGEARMDGAILWAPPAWTRHATMLLMVFAFILIVAAYVPGRIRALVHHPMITSVKVWAFAHLLSNGTVADVVLFGSFLAWAVIDRISLARRERAGLLTVTGGPAQNDIVSLVVGVTLYVVFLLWAHAWLIGVPLM